MDKKETTKTKLRYLLAIHDGVERNSAGYVEIAEVGNHYIGPFKPVKKAGLIKFKKLIDKYQPDETRGIFNFKAMIPSNLLFTDGINVMIWSCKSAKRKLNYKGDFIEVNIPNLIFLTSLNKLSVFAVKVNSITENTKLFIPAFTNLSSISIGRVCMGNSIGYNFDTKTFKQWMDHYENAFFLSEFNSDYFSHLKNNKFTNADEYWEYIFKTKKIPLIETDLTLKKIINEYSTFFTE